MPFAYPRAMPYWAQILVNSALPTKPSNTSSRVLPWRSRVTQVRRPAASYSRPIKARYSLSLIHILVREIQSGETTVEQLEKDVVSADEGGHGA